MNQLLSVVIPSFNEEGMIPRTAKTIAKLLQEAQIPYELLFVNDGSTDTTWEKIQTEAAANPRVKGINFSRNFGKESARSVLFRRRLLCRDRLRPAASSRKDHRNVPALGGRV